MKACLFQHVQMADIRLGQDVDTGEGVYVEIVSPFDETFGNGYVMI